MPVELIVADASPLIVLFKTGLEHLLGALWPKVIVPDAVWDEIQQPDDPAAIGLTQCDWIERAEVAATDPRMEQWHLGAGEASALAFAMQTADCAVLIDDARARKCATSLSIPTLGTGALLILAKRHGHLESVAEALDAVRNAGLWIDDAVVETLLDLADER